MITVAHHAGTLRFMGEAKTFFFPGSFLAGLRHLFLISFSDKHYLYLYYYAYILVYNGK